MYNTPVSAVFGFIIQTVFVLFKPNILWYKPILYFKTEAVGGILIKTNFLAVYSPQPVVTDISHIHKCFIQKQLDNSCILIRISSIYLHEYLA